MTKIKMKTWVAFVMIVLLGIVAVTPAHASDSMRCGAKLITTGFHITQVKALCGEPYGVQVYRYHYDTSYGSQTITVIELVYNFGPNRFLRELRFENSRLVRIELLGYGYN